MLICLLIVCDCFHTITCTLNICEGHHLAPRDENVYFIWPFTKKYICWILGYIKGLGVFFEVKIIWELE